MKELPLTHGRKAIVDDTDFLVLDRFNWCLSDGQYAVRGVRAGGAVIRVYLQRVVAQARRGERVSALNGDTLDCRIGNLVLSGDLPASDRRGGRILGESLVDHPSIRWQIRKLKWSASWKNRQIGFFESDFDAVMAYNRVVFASAGTMDDIIQTFGWCVEDDSYQKPLRLVRGIRRRSLNCWEATGMHNGKRRIIGYFPRQEDAIQARITWEREVGK